MNRMRGDQEGVKARLRIVAAARGTAAGHALDEATVERYAATIALLPPPPCAVLDVGCGTGVLVDVLGELGYQAFGIDINPAAMEGMSMPHRVGGIDAIPEEDQSVDVVLANEILEHLRIGVYEAGIRELARVARQRVVITVPNAESLAASSTRCPYCGCMYSAHGHVRRFDRTHLPALIPSFSLSHSGEVGPYKLRHNLIEWHVRRRLLGRWPAAPSRTCPQCGFRQPGEPTVRSGQGSGLSRAARWIAAVPWRRWWLIAQYDRSADP